MVFSSIRPAVLEVLHPQFVFLALRSPISNIGVFCWSNAIIFVWFILILGGLYAAITFISLLFSGTLIDTVSSPGVYGRLVCMYGIDFWISINTPPPFWFCLSFLITLYPGILKEILGFKWVSVMQAIFIALSFRKCVNSVFLLLMPLAFQFNSFIFLYGVVLPLLLVKNDESEFCTLLIIVGMMVLIRFII